MDSPITKSTAARRTVARSTNENPLCDLPEAKRIVIVDDHPLFRKGLEEMIHSDGSFAVCGDAGNAAEAMDVIRKLTPEGTNWVVTTIAGFAGASGALDGTNDEARFWSPTGVAVDGQGHIFVADTANFTVREIVSEGTNWVVSTIAGRALNFGFADGTNNRAQFWYPYGVAIGGSGRLYVADFGNNAIRQVDSVGTNWAVSTIAGSSGVMGTNDGPGSLATFNSPNSLCVDQTGSTLFVTDQFNDTIRQLTLDGTNWMVSTVAGLALQRGSSDGLGTNAQFRLPWGIAINPAAALYVADYGNHTIRKGLFIPSLGINFSNQSAILSWSILAASYGPEVCTSLGLNPTWVPVTNSPDTNGAILVLTNEPGPAAAFYRLHKK